MASIAVFEDLDIIHLTLDHVAAAGGHEIVGRATSITEAHELLTEMALGNVLASYTLLDGNLDGYEKPTPDFSFQPTEEREIVKKSLFGKRTLIAPAEPITVSPSGSRVGQHGRQISEAIRRCNIPTTVIGISGDPAEAWGGNVDHDLMKPNIGPKLLELISRIEAEK